MKNYGPDCLNGFTDIGYNANFLVNISQYDMAVETLLYYDPLTLIQGNKHINTIEVKRQILVHMQKHNRPIKCFDHIKVWKISY